MATNQITGTCAACGEHGDVLHWVDAPTQSDMDPQTNGDVTMDLCIDCSLEADLI